MGQAMRMMSYSQSKDIASTVPIPSLIINNAPLSFYKLDDNVMGGQSQTHIDKLLQTSSPSSLSSRSQVQQGGTCTSSSTSSTSSSRTRSGVIFAGTINTNGGGFTSIRSKLENGIPKSAKGLKIKYKGDGKTYKILLSDGKGGGPFSSSPSWQCDLPTKKLSDDDDDDNKMEICHVHFDEFIPSFGGRSKLSDEERKKYNFVNEEMKQFGIMLSLKLSDGNPNPVETFGAGVFDFKLEVNDIELI